MILSMVDPDAPRLFAGPALKASFSWTAVLCTLLLLAVAAISIIYGLRLRRFAWDATEPVRFRGDIAAGWNWGGRALDRGLFTFYDDLETDVRNGQHRRNDYPPLRLSIMTGWTAWTRRHFPDATAWRNDYAFTAPMLTANTAAELASSVLVFAIIFLLRFRADDADTAVAASLGKHRRFSAQRAAGMGLVGGLLFWFNPAVIWDSHCWPQWDVWLMPLFLAAVLAACSGWWFTAGVCVAVGACLKGQMLLGAPVLLLWPLFRGYFGAVIRLMSGLVFGAAAIGLPWMHLSSPAWTWLACAATAIVLVRLMDVLSCYALHRKDRATSDRLFDAVAAADGAGDRLRLTPYRSGLRWVERMRAGPPLGWACTLLLVLVVLALAWPWRSVASFEMLLLAWVPLIAAALAGAFRRSTRRAVTALALAIAVLLTMPLMNGGTGWLTMGFLYGTEKFEDMFTGSGSWNVPAMLIRYLQWTRDPGQPVALPGLGQTVTAKILLRGVYAFVMVLCGIAAARQARGRDSRLVVAMVVPWLAAFMLLPQMHGRYSVWAAGFCALLTGESIGLALLGVIVSAVAMMGIVENQYVFVPDYAPDTLALLRRLDPHLGWVLLLSLMILLYVALTPRRSNRADTPLASVLRDPALGGPV